MIHALFLILYCTNCYVYVNIKILSIGSSDCFYDSAYPSFMSYDSDIIRHTQNMSKWVSKEPAGQEESSHR